MSKSKTYRLNILWKYLLQGEDGLGIQGVQGPPGEKGEKVSRALSFVVDSAIENSGILVLKAFEIIRLVRKPVLINLTK